MRSIKFSKSLLLILVLSFVFVNLFFSFYRKSRNFKQSIKTAFAVVVFLFAPFSVPNEALANNDLSSSSSGGVSQLFGTPPIGGNQAKPKKTGLAGKKLPDNGGSGGPGKPGKDNSGEDNISNYPSQQSEDLGQYADQCYKRMSSNSDSESETDDEMSYQYQKSKVKVTQPFRDLDNNPELEKLAEIADTALKVDKLPEKYQSLLEDLESGVKPMDTNKNAVQVPGPDDAKYYILKKQGDGGFRAIVRETNDKVEILGLAPRTRLKLLKKMSKQIKEIYGVEVNWNK